MSDTSPEMDARYRRMLLARSGEERFRMAASMHATARALVIASVRETEPDATPARLRQALFLRFYGHEFDDGARARILARLAVDEGAVRRRRVPIDWDDLEQALTVRSDEMEAFLDLRTGEIRYHQRFGFSGERDDFELGEDELEQGLAEDYLVPIEPISSSVEYDWMVEFADAVIDARLREHLDRALRGRRPFRRFKDELAGSPIARELWHRFHHERVRDAVREWLAEHDIEPTTTPRPSP